MTKYQIKDKKPENLPLQKKAPSPGQAEKEVLADINIEILEQAAKALKGHRHLEAYILLWSTIEQFMLPSLMRFVATKLEIDLPKKIAELPIAYTIKMYFCLTHDKELYMYLERVRKNRNKAIHKMYNQKSWKSVKANLKQDLKDIGRVYDLFNDRFSGRKSVPVLTLYSRGWNDYRKEAIRKINELISTS